MLGRYPGETAVYVFVWPDDEESFRSVILCFMRSAYLIGAIGFDTERDADRAGHIDTFQLSCASGLSFIIHQGWLEQQFGGPMLYQVLI